MNAKQQQHMHRSTPDETNRETLIQKSQVEFIVNDKSQRGEWFLISLEALSYIPHQLQKTKDDRGKKSHFQSVPL